MRSIEFRCLNCGNRVEKDLIPGKHTVLGSLPVVNKEASCCENPEYEDSEGYFRPRQKQSLRDLLPGLA